MLGIDEGMLDGPLEADHVGPAAATSSAPSMM
jgi:hypothetical protein